MALLRAVVASGLGWVFAAVTSVSLAGAIVPDRSIQDDLKAAFLYNFTMYVDWPPVALGEGTEPFRLCVVGDESVSKSLVRIADGVSIAGRALTRVEPETEEAARACHILFIGQETTRTASLLQAVKGVPVLTVSDDPRFLDKGGVIAFVIEENRMRFDVNMSTARAQGLSVSSKLLRLARRVSSPRADHP